MRDSQCPKCDGQMQRVSVSMAYVCPQCKPEVFQKPICGQFDNESCPLGSNHKCTRASCDGRPHQCACGSKWQYYEPSSGFGYMGSPESY
jgi:hypothetical protein